MSIFVFRNYTVERFFGKEYTFSGYDDIIDVPSDAESYVWFYQAPLRVEQDKAVAEIEGYAQKLAFVLSKILSSKNVVAFTMEWLFAVPLTEDNNLRRAINAYNEALFYLTRQYVNLKVLDLSDFCHRYTTAELVDWKYYFISQTGLNPALYKPFKEWYSHKLKELALQRKKCLVLDMDNTLWGGVLGEDGIDGIQIGGDYPGNVFLYFQKALLELNKSGVLLAICSKNNEVDVLDAWEKNPYMVLRKEHFAAWRINWKDKVANIQELAKELNLGLDSFVFVDDSPEERALVRRLLPEVAVPEFPIEPYNLPTFFQELVAEFFRVYTITSEDKLRNEQYRANVLREQAQRGFGDFTDYLRSLDIRLTIEPANDFNIPRIAQLTQKTNQFNLTSRRYTDADVRAFMQDGWKIWCLSVADKYGDDGITGCIMIAPEPPEGERCMIDTFLLSCRVLGKGIENAFFNTVLAQLKKEGVRAITANYIPTLKNGQVASFYEKNGFVVRPDELDGTKHYMLDLSEADCSVEDYYTIA